MADAAAPPSAPLRYDPSVERPEPDEAETHAELVATMRKIADITWKEGDGALRSVHAKSHGLLQGELRVLPGLPEPLAQGLYARPATYPVVLRLSTNPGDVLDDSVTVPRGLAIKVAGVPGERLPGSEADLTQDYVLANAPAFIGPSAKSFLRGLKLLAASTDAPQVLKKALSTALRGAESAVEAVGLKSPTLTSLGGHPMTHILGETFYSQAPLRHGDYVAKLAVAPVSPELAALAGAPLDVRGKPDGLREAVADFFRARGGEWEVRVQLQTDREAMPVEDASVAWPEDRSPYLAVARIAVPPQPAWGEARSAAVDDGLAFSPWHGLAAHRPLGSIMRARKAAYEMSAGLRAERSGRSVAEPRELGPLPA